jgi:molybdate transport system ATP-binding protein
VADAQLAVRLRQPGPIPLDVDFACAPGDVLAIFGPSGSGKTTILRTIAGLSRTPDAMVRCAGVTWTDTSAGTFVPSHRRAVGMVFQEYALFPHMSAAGNVAAALSHVPRHRRAARVDELLHRVGLVDQAHRRPRDLSGGERQRVALARALARDPQVLLLDEPFAAVDRQVRRRLQEEIEALRQTVALPLVLVTHDFEDVARLATHVLLLEKGTSVACGPVTSLMSRPDLSWLRQAVGLGTVFNGTASQSVGEHGLMQVTFDGGSLLVTGHAAPGATVRIRIPAREVILATQAPEGTSLHNILAGTVTAVHLDPAFDHAMVQVAVGTLQLLAEVTRDAVARLGLAEGTSVHALVKSVSIDVFGA